MPALQIRDVPDELYETLKAVAARNHRSLAQEATVALESYVGSRRHEGAPLESRPATNPPAGAATAQRRAAALERIRSRGGLALPPEFADATALVHAVREERDLQIVEGVGSAR